MVLPLPPGYNLWDKIQQKGFVNNNMCAEFAFQIRSGVKILQYFLPHAV